MGSISLEANLGELSKVAGKVVDFMENKKIILFYGEMGSGKTTLIKNICKLLDVTDEVSSPSFSIVNEYNTLKGAQLYHFDFYRLKDEVEAMDMGYEDYFYSGNICLIEWPEKIPSLLPDQHLKVQILHGGNSRTYKLSD